VAVRAASLRMQRLEKAEAALMITAPGIDVMPIVQRAYDSRRAPNLAGRDEWQLCMKDFTAT
jgi:hypothetical protein